TMVHLLKMASYLIPCMGLLLMHSAVYRKQGEVLSYLIKQASVLKKAQDELRKSEIKYRAIVHDQTDLICRFDKNYELTFVNEAVCRLMGKKEKELIGESLFASLQPDERKRRRVGIEGLGTDNNVVSGEYRLFFGDGKLRWVSWTD